MTKELWFKAKTYGWGWTPCSWQGWALIVGYILAIVLVGSMASHHKILSPALGLSLTSALLFICYKKGEKPRWHWGK